MICAGSHLALRAGLHAQLVRAACTLPVVQLQLVTNLVAFLGVYSWSHPMQSAWLSSLVPEVVDAVQSVEGEAGERQGLYITCFFCFVPPLQYTQAAYTVLELAPTLAADTRAFAS